jgi:CubicO group peptidase (beta-lactamase class C family)
MGPGGAVRVRMTGVIAILSTAIMAASSPLASADEPSIENVSRVALDDASVELDKQVASQRIAGGAHMVVRNGKMIHFHIAGVSDIEEQTPLEANAILRIYSMSKPITSVAAMTLWEQGKFILDDPVSKYIPAFANASVLAEPGESDKTVALNRPITVRDVFRHTTGYTYGLETPAVLEYHEKEGLLYADQYGLFPPKMTIAQGADSLARIPAMHQPGASFTYGFSTDVLGRLIEIWSGARLDDYLEQAVLTPLEMIDTGFSVPVEKLDRFGSCHTWSDGKQIVADKANTSPYRDGFAFLSGGGGLVSTMQDYANFSQMLVAGGEYKGKRILKRSTLELIFTDQLSEIAGDFRFGLGFSIDDIQLGRGHSKRDAEAYRWGGYASTAFQVVPEANLFQIFMQQSVPSDHETANKLFSIVYAGTH